MRTVSVTLFFLCVVLASIQAHAQSIFSNLLFPLTAASSGLGEQGVTLLNAVDAMQYNPANLAFTSEPRLTFFRNPWNFMGFGGMPLSSFTLAAPLQNGGSVGIQYTYWDFGEAPYATQGSPDGTSGFVHLYERSVGAGYAMPVNDDLFLGGTVRYAWRALNQNKTIDHLLISAGVTYQPQVLKDRLTAGLSFMNFGTAVEVLDRTDPPPAHLDVGINGIPITDEFCDIAVSLGVSKPLAKYDGPPTYAGRSSFNSLFTDWDNFPEDVFNSIGISYRWHPLNLGSGVSFFEESYLGFFSQGTIANYYSFLTHGFKIGLRLAGIEASAGFAGRWHNGSASVYYPWEFPWETFEFGLKSSLNIPGINSRDQQEPATLHGITLAAGFSYGSVTGKLKQQVVEGYSVSSSDNTAWSLHADFYVSENSALISSFAYSRMKESFAIQTGSIPYFPPVTTIDLTLETFSLDAGYRYHPQGWNPFFVQASLGIIRMNPTLPHTTPRYTYKEYDRLGVGAVVPVVGNAFVVTPTVGLTTIFMEQNSIDSHLGGYNQFDFGFEIGYRF